MDAIRQNPGWSAKAAGALRFLTARLAGYPTLVNLEVTRKCNARCDFCRYWRLPAEQPLDDYLPVIRKLRPSVVAFTGGEPLLRRDLARLVGDIRRSYPCMYLTMVTNGALLTVERGLELWNAGLNQITVSLDFPDERHDRARGIPGLTRKIFRTVPELISAGIDNLVIQTVIKTENLDCVYDIIEWAASKDAHVSLSAYTAAKNGNDSHNVTPGQMSALHRLVGEAVSLKLRGGNIASSTYYLRRIPEYFETGGIGGCASGRKFVTVSPSGLVYRCSESPDGCHYTEWTPGRFGSTDCRACWVPCRGESQAPVNWERIKQVAALYSRRGYDRIPALQHVPAG